MIYSCCYRSRHQNNIHQIHIIVISLVLLVIQMLFLLLFQSFPLLSTKQSRK
jgi:hypothetical protein